MPRATSKIVHSQPSSVFETLQHENMNKEIIWTCIVMATLICILIIIALSYIAYEKWKKYRELRTIHI